MNGGWMLNQWWINNGSKMDQIWMDGWMDGESSIDEW
jgi:hypothetical protein